MDDLVIKAATRYRAEVARGEHDDECEYDARGFLLCHCSKRRREAEGFADPPSEPLYFPPPDCPRCDRSLLHDGDQWACEDCSLAWSDNGFMATFTDDYGDDLAAQARRWRVKRSSLSSIYRNQEADR